MMNSEPRRMTRWAVWTAAATLATVAPDATAQGDQHSVEPLEWYGTPCPANGSGPWWPPYGLCDLIVTGDPDDYTTSPPGFVRFVENSATAHLGTELWVFVGTLYNADQTAFSVSAGGKELYRFDILDPPPEPPEPTPPPTCAHTDEVSIYANLGSTVTEGEEARFSVYDANGVGPVNLEVTQSGYFIGGTADQPVPIVNSPGHKSLGFPLQHIVLTVGTLDDSEYENDGSVTVTILPGDCYTVQSGRHTATVTVENNDPHPAGNGPSEATHGPYPTKDECLAGPPWGCFFYDRAAADALSSQGGYPPDPAHWVTGWWGWAD